GFRMVGPARQHRPAKTEGLRRVSILEAGDAANDLILYGLHGYSSRRTGLCGAENRARGSGIGPVLLYLSGKSLSPFRVFTLAEATKPPAGRHWLGRARRCRLAAGLEPWRGSRPRQPNPHRGYETRRRSG